LDGIPRAIPELVDRPVVDRDADDRTVEQAALLEPVERVERHHLRQVARDAEDDEDVGRLLAAFRARLARFGCCNRHPRASLLLANFPDEDSTARRVSASSIRDEAPSLFNGSEWLARPADDRSTLA
jgi:hypothetical protein